MPRGVAGIDGLRWLPGGLSDLCRLTMSAVVYGRNAVVEALRAGRVQQVLLAAGTGSNVGTIEQLAREHEVPVARLDRRELDRLAAGVNHQGVIAQVSPFQYAELDDLLRVAQERREPPFLLILDCIQDPQNLGTLLRTAEAAAVHGVVIPRHRAAEVTPAVVKASAGAVEHLKIAREANLTQTIARLKAAGLWVTGVEDAPGARDYDQADFRGPVALVVGSEGRGISRLVRESCDFLVRVPMHGQVTSLNAAVAGSIVVYEAMRQRR